MNSRGHIAYLSAAQALTAIGEEWQANYQFLRVIFNCPGANGIQKRLASAIIGQAQGGERKNKVFALL